MQRRFSIKRCTGLVRWLVQLLCLSFACYCGSSRVMDYRHHVWDVLAGSCVGIFFGIFGVRVQIVVHSTKCRIYIEILIVQSFAETTNVLNLQ